MYSSSKFCPQKTPIRSPLHFVLWWELFSSSKHMANIRPGRIYGVRRRETAPSLAALRLGRKKQRFSGTNQKPELPRPFGTGPLKPCPQGPFFAFLTFLRPNLFLAHLDFSPAPLTDQDGQVLTHNWIWTTKHSSDHDRQKNHWYPKPPYAGLLETNCLLMRLTSTSLPGYLKPIRFKGKLTLTSPRRKAPNSPHDRNKLFTPGWPWAWEVIFIYQETRSLQWRKRSSGIETLCESNLFQSWN